MDESIFYAHSVENKPCSKWHSLEDHLHGTAYLSQQFSQSFDSGEWGFLAGLWHDLGKYQKDFQKRMLGENIAVEHSGIGAVLSLLKDRDLGNILAFTIAGHHTGLPNLATSNNGSQRELTYRIKHNISSFNKCINNIPESIINKSLPQYTDFLKLNNFTNAGGKDRLLLMMDFWIRFLFSSLVDADWLDTERFLDKSKNLKRSNFESLNVLKQKCDDFIDSKIRKLPPEERLNPINMARASMLEACRMTAEKKPGIFSLTVPTGGGKTLSSMSFALNHSVKYDLQRVIVVIPYTSIIEQNAQVYRDAMGDMNIIEHHSNLDLDKSKDKIGYELTEKHSLAAENWDAPIIITTTVQFFESLFSNKPARCRKLHNIVKSVIILDEVQTLPPGFLNPILDVLGQLVKYYGCSLVLSTATPPALAHRETLSYGLENVQPIIVNSQELKKKFERTEIIWPKIGDPPIDWDKLADELYHNKHEQILCIVHRRKDARELSQCLLKKGWDNIYHLSALMCPNHRMKVIQDINIALRDNKPCRVISTQLIEAGVDFDFPVVYRAFGGLDSIIQAAGRCNRERKHKCGRVVVFRSPTDPPRGVPQTALQITDSILKKNNGKIDTNNSDIFDEYFRQLYFIREKDEKNIQGNRKEFNFATVSNDFQMIQDGFTYTIVVPWGDATTYISNLQKSIELKIPTRNAIRALQPYTVHIYEKSFNNLLKAGVISEIFDGLYIISKPYEHIYHKQYGLIEGDEQPLADPSALYF